MLTPRITVLSMKRVELPECLSRKLQCCIWKELSCLNAYPRITMLYMKRVELSECLSCKLQCCIRKELSCLNACSANYSAVYEESWVVWMLVPQITMLYMKRVELSECLSRKLQCCIWRELSCLNACPANYSAVYKKLSCLNACPANYSAVYEESWVVWMLVPQITVLYIKKVELSECLPRKLQCCIWRELSCLNACPANYSAVY